MKKIALLGEFDPTRETQIATIQAIGHSSTFLGMAVDFEWVSTADITKDLFHQYQGIWVAPGSIFKDQENLFRAIRFAREQKIPCLAPVEAFSI